MPVWCCRPLGGLQCRSVGVKRATWGVHSQGCNLRELAGEHTRGGQCGSIGFNAGKGSAFIEMDKYSELVINTSDDMGIYEEAFESKYIAAKIILPLIEFEFGFKGLDSPELIQSVVNITQLQKIFSICQKHNWVTFSEIKNKGGNFYFRISKSGFLDIYKIAGPFADPEKNVWSELLFERMGKKGGYRRGLKQTELKVTEVLKKEKTWMSVNQICLNLRLLPSVVRNALRNLQKDGKLRKLKTGKAIFWKII